MLRPTARLTAINRRRKRDEVEGSPDDGHGVFVASRWGTAVVTGKKTMKPSPEVQDTVKL